MFSSVNKKSSSGVGGKRAIHKCPCDCGGLVDPNHPNRHKCPSGKHGDQNSLLGGCCLYDEALGWNSPCKKCGEEAFGQKNRYSTFLMSYYSSLLVDFLMFVCVT